MLIMYLTLKGNMLYYAGFSVENSASRLSDHILLHNTGKFRSPKNPSTYPMPLWKTSPGMPECILFLAVQKNKGAMPYAKKNSGDRICKNLYIR